MPRSTTSLGCVPGGSFSASGALAVGAADGMPPAAGATALASGTPSDTAVANGGPSVSSTGAAIGMVGSAASALVRGPAEACSASSAGRAAVGGSGTTAIGAPSSRGDASATASAAASAAPATGCALGTPSIAPKSDLHCSQNNAPSSLSYWQNGHFSITCSTSAHMMGSRFLNCDAEREADQINPLAYPPPGGPRRPPPAGSCGTPDRR